MTIDDLIAELAARDVRLWAEGDGLRYRGPAGAISPRLREGIVRHKTSLLGRLGSYSCGDQGVYPLSYGQEAMWFLHRLAPESSAYNVSVAFRLLSGLDVPALRRAVGALPDRHPVLRTTFLPGGRKPLQRTDPAIGLELAEVPTSGEDADRLKSRVRRAAQAPFDLVGGSLARALLFETSEGEYVFLLAMHHIIIDAGSVAMLVKDLVQVYRAEAAGRAASRPQAARAYSEFVHEQAELVAGPEGARLLHYWREQLGGDLPVLDLPTDRPRPPTQTRTGDSLSIELDPDLVERLRGLGRSEGVTFYTVLLTGFAALLNRYTGQDAVIVGTPVGHLGGGYSGSVGLFMNTVALRLGLSSDPSVGAALRRTHETVVGALAHAAYPFGVLVDQLQVKRTSDRPPVFQVVFDYKNLRPMGALAPLFAPGDEGRGVDFGGVVARSYLLPQQEGQFDLALEVYETEESVTGWLKYDPALFDRETVRRMVGHWQTLLAKLAEGAAGQLADLPLLTDVERTQVLEGWNATAAVFPQDMCVHELFEEQVRRTPDAVAVSCDGRITTYSELDAQSDRLATRLRFHGVGPTSLVGLYVDRSEDMVVGLLAVLKAGGAYVPLDPDYPARRIAQVLEQARPAVVLTHRRHVVALGGFDGRVVCLDDEDELDPHSVNGPLEPATADALAYVIFTSGSTGQPKGVEIRHRSVVNFLTTMRERLGVSPRDVFAAVTSLSFDIAVLELLLPLTTGGQVVIFGRQDAADGRELGRRLREEGVTIVQSTPAGWQTLLAAGWTGLSGLKGVCGGRTAVAGAGAATVVARGAAVERVRADRNDRLVNAVRGHGPGRADHDRPARRQHPGVRSGRETAACAHRCAGGSVHRRGRSCPRILE